MLQQLLVAGGQDGERISSERSSAAGKATAPPASVTSSWAAAASTERIGRSVSIPSSWPAATRHSVIATEPSARMRRASTDSIADAAAATSSGRAVSSPSTSSGPGRSGGRGSPSRNAPSPFTAHQSRPGRGSSPAERRGSSSATQPISTSPIRGPEAMAIETHANGSPRLALREPSTGSMTMRSSLPPAI